MTTPAERVRGRVDSSILAAHLESATDIGRRWVCANCGTTQVVDEELRYPLHLRHLVQTVSAGVAAPLASGICTGSYTQVPAVREAWITDVIEEELGLLREIHEHLKDGQREI